ncbi:MAG: alpha-E domain-containing protein [Chloroflexi bacterium]|nr:alpha-E domain-containing protein [Chloroflexota bacterium]
MARSSSTPRRAAAARIRGCWRRGSAERRWERMLAALRAPELPSYVVERPDGVAGASEGLEGVAPLDPYGITRFLVFDAANASSIVACVEEARDNARQVREQISSEMWEQLNRLYLQVKNADMDTLWHAEPHEFYRMVREGAHLFQGIADATMSHGEGWHFIQLGRYIERAGATVALLDAYVAAPPETPPDDDASVEYQQWVSLLKSCTAFEAYSKVYTADVRPARIVEFLLLDAEFPRSLRFMAAAIQVGLQAIARATGVVRAGRAERLAGRLRATLDYSGIDEIMGEAMHPYLGDIGRQCAAIHAAVYQTYILQQHLDGRRRWVEEPAPPHGDGAATAIGEPLAQTRLDTSGDYNEDQMQQQQTASIDDRLSTID